MTMNLTLFSKGSNMGTRLFLVSILTVMLIFSICSATELSHAYAAEKKSNLSEKKSNLSEKKSNLSEKKSNLSEKKSNLSEKTKKKIPVLPKKLVHPFGELKERR